MKDDLWNELALEALTKRGSGINVSPTLDIAHPETIRNYRAFGEMLADAYRKGAESKPDYKTALDEWLDKTDWVQKESATFPFNTLGMHRADVLKKEIELLRPKFRIEHLESESEPTPKPPDDVVPDDYTISLDDGKYKVRREFGRGLTFYRNGEFWNVGTEEFKYVKVIGSMVYRIAELEMAIGQVLEGSLDYRLVRQKNGLDGYLTSGRAPLGQLHLSWQTLLRTALDKK